MTQFNAYEPEQNNKKSLVEAWHIACAENIKLRKQIEQLEKDLAYWQHMAHLELT